jgi:hypothetical protein
MTLDLLSDTTMTIDLVSSPNEEVVPQIRIFPNPTNEVLTIETGRFDRYTIEIYSLCGQLLRRDVMEGTSKPIDLSSFKKGVYFITLWSMDQVWTEKIIK